MFNRRRYPIYLPCPVLLPNPFEPHQDLFERRPQPGVLAPAVSDKPPDAGRHTLWDLQSCTFDSNAHDDLSREGLVFPGHTPCQHLPENDPETVDVNFVIDTVGYEELGGHVRHGSGSRVLCVEERLLVFPRNPKINYLCPTVTGEQDVVRLKVPVEP